MQYGTTYYISAVAGNEDLAGGVDFSDPCLQVAAGTPVTFFEIPTATLSGSDNICDGESVELAIHFTGDQPWEVTIDSQVLTNIMTPDITYTVTPASTTLYTLSAFTDNNCPGLIFDSANVVVNYPPVFDNVSSVCNPDTNTYTVTFDIIGGDPASYILTPLNGSFSGPSFTSNPIASDVVYQFVIDDANHCGTDTISGVMSCDCETDAGTMSANLFDKCVNEGIAVPASSGLNLDADDVLVYYLHTGSGASLGDVIATNNQPGFNFDPNTMQAGVTYYISAVVGNNDGSGGVDFTDFCLDVAPGTPVLWNPLPTVQLIGSDAVCEGQPATVTMTMDGVGPYNVSYSIDGSPQSSANVTSPFSFDIFPTAETTVQMIAVTDLGAGCSSPSSESAVIFVSQNVEAGNVTGNFEACEDENLSLNLADNIIGADSGGVWTDANFNPVPNGLVNTGGLASGTYDYTYTVAASAPCYGDSVKVQVVIHPNPVADAGTDHELDCDATEVTLGGNNTTPGLDYNWAGGNVSDSTLLHPTTIEPGVYTLTVTNLQTGCTATDAATVNQTVTQPEPHITIAGVSCFGEKDGFILIDSITNGEPPYLVSFDGGPFINQTQFLNLSPGTYSLTIEDGAGCERNVEITVVEPEQVNVELVLEIEGNQNIISLGDSVKLVVVVTPPFDSLDAIIWTPAGIVPCDTCQENWIHPMQETNFSIMVDENGCTDEDQVTVYVKKDRPIYVPNAFSPNNDGRNDVFHIFAGQSVVEIRSFLVFNRWGETVYQYYHFQPNDPAFGWDGKHRGKELDPAVFTWFAEVEFIDGRVIVYEGDVTLVK
jgi:gliding motility-associated-like protein